MPNCPVCVKLLVCGGKIKVPKVLSTLVNIYLMVFFNTFFCFTCYLQIFLNSNWKKKNTTNYLPKYIHTIKPRYKETRYSEFCDIVNKTQLAFWGFLKHSTFNSELFDIVNKKGLTDMFVISRFECISI